MLRITNDKETKSKLKRQDLVEPELSYKIVGTLFRVYNELGPGLYEKNYQRAVAIGLSMERIDFKQEVPIKLKFIESDVGRYFADFIIGNKVVLELKSGNQINRGHVRQLIAYLKSTSLSLGILASFGKDGVFFKRIINIDS